MRDNGTGTIFIREQLFVLHGDLIDLQLMKYTAKSGELHRMYVVRVKHGSNPIFWEGFYDPAKAEECYDRQLRHYATRVARVALA